MRPDEPCLCRACLCVHACVCAGGSMRMTVATCVMLLELTNNLALLPLMMLVTLVAKVRCSVSPVEKPFILC